MWINIRTFKTQPISIIGQREDSLDHSNRCLKVFYKIQHPFSIYMPYKGELWYETISEQKHTQVTVASSGGREETWPSLDLDLQKQDGKV